MQAIFSVLQNSLAFKIYSKSFKIVVDKNANWSGSLSTVNLLIKVAPDLNLLVQGG